MVFWNEGKGIKLSHYNLLVNANGIQHAIDLFENQTYHISIEPDSMVWVILQAMLPLYTGAPLTSENPDMKLGIDEGDFRKFNLNGICLKKHLPLLFMSAM